MSSDQEKISNYRNLALLLAIKLELTGRPVKNGNMLLWTACMHSPPPQKKKKFISFQFIYGFLSVHEHKVSATVFPNCLCQLPSCRTQVNLCNTIVYIDIKIYHSNVKTLRFLKKLLSHPLHISLCSLGTSNHFFSASQLHIGILISGLISIHKMLNVPGFRSVGHTYFHAYPVCYYTWSEGCK